MTTRCPHCNGRLPRRMQFTHPDRGAETWLAVVLPIVVAGALLYLAYHTSGINWPWQSPRDERLFLGAATYGFILFADGLFISTLHVTVPMLYEWLFGPEPEPEQMQAEQPADRIVTVERTPTSARSLVRPPAPAFVNEYQLWVMLTAISGYDDVTFSEETARDKRVVSSREDYRKLLRWLVDEELYVTARDDPYDNQGGGDITDYCRSLIIPSPSEVSANTDERPPGTDERTDGEGEGDDG